MFIMLVDHTGPCLGLLGQTDIELGRIDLIDGILAMHRLSEG
jgi:hypothetical protein